MLATVRTKPALHQRVRLMIVAALLMLSLGLGIATTAQRVDAKAGHRIVCRITPGGWWVETTQESHADVTGLVCVKE